MERNWEELRTVLDSPFSSHLGYIDPRRFLEKLNAARNGEQIHILRMLRTISLEFWLRDLAERGMIDCAPVLPLSPSKRTEQVLTRGSTDVNA
jgi:hypothetical protein